MIKIENVVLPSPEQWDAIIRGMRNPKNSWDKSDSYQSCVHGPCDECKRDKDFYEFCEYFGSPNYIIGENDHKLMMDLSSGGPVHAKYRRMIVVYLDITAPLFWWKEFDTYKIGTVTNSCSTMHKIHAKRFEMSDFSTEYLLPASYKSLGFTIKTMNEFREIYLQYDKLKSNNVPVSLIDADEKLISLVNKYSKKNIWWQMIQLLPSSYNQKRTVMLNYEVLAGIYPMRKNHKLDEWRKFCSWIESLPYSELITGVKKYTLDFLNKEFHIPEEALVNDGK